MISNDPEVEIVAEADNGEDAVKLIMEMNPDVAVLDISMPGKTGLEVAQEIMGSDLKTEIVILTMYKEEDFLLEAIDSGVKGYVLKNNTADELITAINTVAKGESYISPSLSGILVKSRANKKRVNSDNPKLESLSPTEKKVLGEIALNKTSRQIADEMNISFRTVQKHRSNICEKLDLRGWNALLNFAIKNKTALS